jgi:hypothetical protein
MSSNMNLKVKGKWTLDNDKGTLTIIGLTNNDSGITCATIRTSNNDEAEYLQLLEPSARSDRLVYKGEVDRWGCCRDDFEVTLTLKYDPESDTIIDGDVDVSPPFFRTYENRRYGPRYAYGERFKFTATHRK